MAPKYQTQDVELSSLETKKLLVETHDKVCEIHVTLFGVNSKGGHLEDYQKTKEKVESHNNKLLTASGIVIAIVFIVKLIHF